MKLNFNIKTYIDKDLTIEQLKIVLFKSMLKMHELATMNCPVDRGRLQNSIILTPATPGYDSYLLADGVEYGEDVEYGTAPHMVAIKELKDWSRRVIGDEGAAYGVAAKIAKEGTDAQPFFRPAMDQVKNIWVERFTAQVFG